MTVINHNRLAEMLTKTRNMRIKWEKIVDLWDIWIIRMISRFIDSIDEFLSKGFEQIARRSGTRNEMPAERVLFFKALNNEYNRMNVFFKKALIQKGLDENRIFNTDNGQSHQASASDRVRRRSRKHRQRQC